MFDKDSLILEKKYLQMHLEQTQEYNPNEETWLEWVEWKDYIEKSIFEKFLSMKEVKEDWILDNAILKIFDDENQAYFEIDEKGYQFLGKEKEDLENWVSNLNVDQKLELLNLSERDIYISGWETTIKDFSEYGGIVYHYTTPEKWEKIKKTGFLNPSYGSGITNRSAYGIFTSIDPEEHADGAYGDICLKINLEKFKKENNIEFLDISPEPDVFEDSVNSAFYHELGIDYDGYVPSDMSTFTVIVGHSVPVNCIEIFGE